MPIPVKELEEADLREMRGPLPERILRFLGKRPDQAFTDVEILGGIDGHSETSLTIAMIFWDKDELATVLTPIRNALDELAGRGALISGARSGIVYWAAGRAGRKGRAGGRDAGSGRNGRRKGRA